MHARQHLEVILAIKVDIGKQEMGGAEVRDPDGLLAQGDCLLGIP